MSIAAKLAGALPVALPIPVAARAEHAPENRAMSGSGSAPLARKTPALAGEGSVEQDLRARLKKKKQPRFQTRFFAE